MPQPYKVCPICDTRNQRGAVLCSTCGASLQNILPIRPDEKPRGDWNGYEHQYGETDLFEGNLRWRGSTYTLGVVVFLGVMACAVGIMLAGSRLFTISGQPISGDNDFLTLTPPATDLNNLFVTNTPFATLFLPTVTPGAPTPTLTETPTITPTQGPCIQQVLPGDDLIAIMFRCGHRQFDTLLQIVLDLNNLSDPTRIQVGQNIEVPWPTATFDPNAVAPPTAAVDSGSVLQVAAAPTENDSSGLRLQPTETLQPDISWHQVQKDENIIIIAVNYGATLRILSELNPEVQFSQCDFGIGTGGPNCVVSLYEGQLIRVPAPTPTPTIQPTPSGSETATPTATPTFNQPSILSPSDLALFQSNDIVTLRWTATGSLNAQQAYRIRLEDQTANKVYSADTQELFFIIPEEWHSEDGQRHEYLWSVAVVEANQTSYSTEPRRFTWLGRGSP